MTLAMLRRELIDYMGYYTRHYIKTIDLLQPNVSLELNADFFNSCCWNRTRPTDEYWQPTKDGRYYFEMDECSWYEHEEDLLKISKDYPEVVFIIDGKGEDSGDIWREFYLNGKLVHRWTPAIEPPEWGQVKDRVL
jgi:hypothetical protein